MANNWTKHKGGPCPVPEDTKVDVRLRDGAELYRHDAGSLARGDDWWRWQGGYDYNIVAWRHHAPAQETTPQSSDADLLQQAVEALQEAREKVAFLTARIAALEGKP